mgnify:CR=1 FL=1
MSKANIVSLIFILLLMVGCRSVEQVKPVTETKTIEISEPVESSPAPSLSLLQNKIYDGRDFLLGPILARANKYTRYYITYLSGQLKISGIMNVPTGDGPFPILILNHGYIDPAIYTNGRGLKREQDYFANNDYIVIHPDYRNHADSDKDENSELNFRLGYAEDVINLIYAVKASDLDYFDEEKIGMLGHSMGGGVTMNILVTQPNLVQAAVLYAPVSANVGDNFDRWTRTRPEVAEKIIATYGEPKDNPEFYDNLSPINYLDQIQTPVLLHHGTADADVPIAWSNTFNQAMVSAGKTITYHIYDGAPHEFIKDWPAFMQRNLNFFDLYLKGQD